MTRDAPRPWGWRDRIHTTLVAVSVVGWIILVVGFLKGAVIH